MKFCALILLIIWFRVTLGLTGCVSSASHATPFGSMPPATATNYYAKAFPSGSAAYRLYIVHTDYSTNHVDAAIPSWGPLPVDWKIIYARGLDTNLNESALTSNSVTNQ